MKTTIILDDNLLKEAFMYSNVCTKNEIINLALKEFVENHKRKDLRKLKGKFQFAYGYDYKELRK